MRIIDISCGKARRTFLEAAAAFLAGGGKLFAGSIRRLVPNKQEQRAADRGRKLGIGTVSLEGPDRVEANTYLTGFASGNAGRPSSRRTRFASSRVM